MARVILLSIRGGALVVASLAGARRVQGVKDLGGVRARNSARRVRCSLGPEGSGGDVLGYLGTGGKHGPEAHGAGAGQRTRQGR